MSGKDRSKDVEVEVRGVMSKEEYEELGRRLDAEVPEKETDDRETVFFMIPGKTLKVTKKIGKSKAKIALKTGDFIEGKYQTEREVEIDEDDFGTMVEIFKDLGFNQVQYTSQKRTNYQVGELEVALKWSEDWGYHFEIDKTVSDDEDKEKTRQEVTALAARLGLKVFTEEEFREFCARIDEKHRKLNPR